DAANRVVPSVCKPHSPVRSSCNSIRTRDAWVAVARDHTGRCDSTDRVVGRVVPGVREPEGAVRPGSDLGRDVDARIAGGRAGAVDRDSTYGQVAGVREPDRPVLAG